jgi:hypothetical protein
MMLTASVRRTHSVVALNLGLVAGGALTGVCLAVASAVVRPPMAPMWSYLVLGVVCAVLFAHEIRLVRLRLPQRRRLVPITVFRFGPVFGALEFGIEMGSGLRTYVSSAAPYAVVAAALLTADSLDAVLAGIGFGLGRATMTTASVVSRDPDAWDRRWADGSRTIQTGLYVMMMCTLIAQAQGR